MASIKKLILKFSFLQIKNGFVVIGIGSVFAGEVSRGPIITKTSFELKAPSTNVEITFFGLGSAASLSSYCIQVPNCFRGQV